MSAYKFNVSLYGHVSHKVVFKMSCLCIIFNSIAFVARFCCKISPHVLLQRSSMWQIEVVVCRMTEIYAVSINFYTK